MLGSPDGTWSQKYFQADQKVLVHSHTSHCYSSPNRSSLKTKCYSSLLWRKWKIHTHKDKKNHHDSHTILCPYPYSFFIFPIDKNKVKNVLEDVTLSKIYFRQGICKIMSAEKIHSIQKNMRSTAMDPSQKNEVTNFL